MIKKMTNKTSITVETLSGIKTLDLKIEKGKVSLVTVDMGEPILDADKIPVINGFKEKSLNGIDFINVKVEFKKIYLCVNGKSSCNMFY